MRDTTPGKINQACQALFSESADVAMPRLMDELARPHRIAGRLDVTTTAVRQWFETRGWDYDPEQDKWIAPETEAEHAPAV